jgi:hypothetical protein
MNGHGTPAAANLQHMVSIFDACLHYQGVELVKLRLL